MIVEIRGVIYVDALASWQGLSLNIASKEDLTQFLPNLGNHLRTKLGDEHIIENYELFVVRGDKRDYYFVAQDCVIDKTLP
ncbi:MAG: hypothetical protein CL607_02680 [Anaerolineaceae bacterium]|nr:hypothetical protein [Anaerolineaceae bacterium]